MSTVDARKGSSKRLGRVLFALFVALTIVLTSFILLITATHSRAFAVQSDSMHPTLSKGDLVVIKPVPAEEFESGDIVTISFRDKSGVFTHRVTRTDEQTRKIYTKGDNNPAEDPRPADYADAVGILWLRVPYLGTLTLITQSRTALIVLAVSALVALIAGTVLTGVKKTKTGGGDHAA